MTQWHIHLNGRLYDRVTLSRFKGFINLYGFQIPLFWKESDKSLLVDFVIVFVFVATCLANVVTFIAISHRP